MPRYHHQHVCGPSIQSFGRILTKLRSLIVPMGTTNDRRLMNIRPVTTVLWILEISSWSSDLAQPICPGPGKSGKMPRYHHQHVCGPSIQSFGRIFIKLRLRIVPMGTTNGRSLANIRPFITELWILEISSWSSDLTQHAPSGQGKSPQKHR